MELAQIIEQVGPFLVAVRAYDRDNNLIASGSGCFWGSDGHIITSYRLVSTADRMEVVTIDETVYPVDGLVAIDRLADLVMLAIDIPSIEPKFLYKRRYQYSREPLLLLSNLNAAEPIEPAAKIAEIREIVDLGNILRLAEPVAREFCGGVAINYQGKIVGTITYFSTSESLQFFIVPIERAINLQPGPLQPLPIETGAPDSPAELFYRGLQQIQTANYLEAIKYFEAVLVQDPKHAQALFRLGNCYLKLKQYREALSVYYRAIRRQPDFYWAYTQLGITYFFLDEYRLAEKSLKKALSIKKDFVRAYDFLITIYLKSTRHQRALSLIDEARRAGADSDFLAYQTGWIYLQTKKYPAAVEIFQGLIDSGTEWLAQSYFSLGEALLYLQRYPAAITAYQSTIELDSEHIESYCQQARAYFHLQRYQEAIAVSRKAIEIDPDHADPYWCLGTIYCELKDYPAALAAYRELVRNAPQMAESHYNLGCLFLTLNQFDNAVTEFRQAISLNNQMADAHNHLGMAYEALGRNYDAALAFKEAHRLDPSLSTAGAELRNYVKSWF